MVSALMEHIGHRRVQIIDCSAFIAAEANTRKLATGTDSGLLTLPVKGSG